MFYKLRSFEYKVYGEVKTLEVKKHEEAIDMKNKYENLDMEIIYFDTENIITDFSLPQGVVNDIDENKT